MNDKITREPIMKIMHGLWSFRTLYAATDLEIFTKVSQGKNTAEKIAEDLETKEDAIERLLNACVALDLLEKKGKEYENSQETEKFLVKEKSDYYGNMIIMFGIRNSLKDIEKVILDRSLKKENLKKRMENPEQAKIFTKAMHDNAIGPARILSKKFDFSKFKKLLDLGGGSGAYSIILTKQYSNLEATIFELPNVCEVAEKFIHEAGVEKKVKTFLGDFFKDELPENHDVVLLSQIIHSFSAEKNKSLLKKIYTCLPKGGVLIINEFLLNKEKTGPLFSALFSLNMLINSDDGNSYNEDEIKNWLADVGFEYLETIKLIGPVSSIIAKK